MASNSKPQRTRQHGTPSRTPEQQPPREGVDRSADAQRLLEEYASDARYPRTHYNRRRSSGNLAPIAATTALVALAGAALWGIARNDGSEEKDKAPVVTEAPEIETEGTVPWTPEENDGYRAGVLKEAQDSGITLSDEQLDELVDDARLLNPNPQYEGRYLEPQLGEPMNLPNIIGPGGIDQTPPEQP